MRTYCPGDSVNLAELSCKGEPFEKVTLSRTRPYGDVVMVELHVQTDTYEARLPDAVCKGVWRLTVKTSCGCHHTHIKINCDSVRFADERVTTNMRPVGEVCCE